MRVEVGVAQAKDRLSELLERAAGGEEFAITRRGVVLARLVPPHDEDRGAKRAEAVQALLKAREGTRLGELDLRSLVEEGQR